MLLTCPSSLCNSRNDLWTTKSHLCVKRMSPNRYIKFYKQFKINFEKRLGHRVFKNHKVRIITNHFNPLQACPSFPCFVFDVLFIPSLNFVSGYFYSFTHFGGSYLCLNFDKFRDLPGWLESLCFCMEIICWAPLISQVQNTGLPLTFSEHSLVNIKPSAEKKNWELFRAFFVKLRSLLVDRLKGDNIYYQTYVGC